jgi:hypothetical protein
MPLDEVVFLLRGRLVLAPCVPFVEHDFSGVDELLGVFEGVPAEFHGHDPAPQDIPDVRVCGEHDALHARRFSRTPRQTVSDQVLAADP